jgi:hypothetical protein
MTVDESRQVSGDHVDRIVSLAGGRRCWSGSRAPPTRLGPVRAW